MAIIRYPDPLEELYRSVLFGFIVRAVGAGTLKPFG